MPKFSENARLVALIPKKSVNACFRSCKRQPTAKCYCHWETETQPTGRPTSKTA